jgi:hypothetical protein
MIVLSVAEIDEGLPGRLPGPPPHSQGTQEKGTEEHDNADDQQVQQALDDDTQDAEHNRHEHEEEEQGKHLMLRSVVGDQRRASCRSPPAPA